MMNNAVMHIKHAQPSHVCACPPSIYHPLQRLGPVSSSLFSSYKFSKTVTTPAVTQNVKSVNRPLPRSNSFSGFVTFEPMAASC